MINGDSSWTEDLTDLVNVPVGHTACAALTQPSHLPFETLIVAPASSGVSVNFDVPDAPVVVVGSPPQNSIEPAIPPQTFVESHVSTYDYGSEGGMSRELEKKRSYCLR